jgi:hypothetical protein
MFAATYFALLPMGMFQMLGAVQSPSQAHARECAAKTETYTVGMSTRRAGRARIAGRSCNEERKAPRPVTLR